MTKKRSIGEARQGIVAVKRVLRGAAKPSAVEKEYIDECLDAALAQLGWLAQNEAELRAFIESRAKLSNAQKPSTAKEPRAAR